MTFDDEIADGLSDIADDAGRKIRLRRGAISFVITAVPGTTKTLTQVSDGVRLQVRERDYILRSDLYRFSGDDCREPLPGDLIDDQGRVYEVTRLGDAVDCWEWSDRGETHYRIHAREIGRS